MTFEEADAAYPFDPKAKPEFLVGFERLRCFELPEMRRKFWEGEKNFQERREPAKPRKPSWDEKPARTRAAVTEEREPGEEP